MVRQLVRVGVHVDEAGRHDAAGGVEHRRGGGAGELSDRRDASAADAHVGPLPRPAGAVDDRAAAHQHVECGRLRGRACDERGAEDGSDCGSGDEQAASVHDAGEYTGVR